MFGTFVSDVLRELGLCLVWHWRGTIIWVFRQNPYWGTIVTLETAFGAWRNVVVSWFSGWKYKTRWQGTGLCYSKIYFSWRAQDVMGKDVIFWLSSGQITRLLHFVVAVCFFCFKKKDTSNLQPDHNLIVDIITMSLKPLLLAGITIWCLGHSEVDCVSGSLSLFSKTLHVSLMRQEMFLFLLFPISTYCVVMNWNVFFPLC